MGERPQPGAWFCVIDMRTGELLYSGRHVSKAAVALVPGTHFAWSDTLAGAQAQAVNDWRQQCNN